MAQGMGHTHCSSGRVGPGIRGGEGGGGAGRGGGGFAHVYKVQEHTGVHHWLQCSKDDRASAGFGVQNGDTKRHERSVGSEDGGGTKTVHQPKEPIQVQDAPVPEREAERRPGGNA